MSTGKKQAVPVEVTLDALAIELDKASGTGSRLAEIMELVGATDKDAAKALAFVTENQENNGYTEYRFEVAGDPPISKRPRAVRMRNKAGATVGVRMYAEDGGKQDSMAQQFSLQLPKGFVPLEGEVELYFHIYRPMLSGWPMYKRILAEAGYVRPESRPDFDNFSKILTDAMNGVMFKDDGQVVVGNVSLFYSIRPRLEVLMCGRKRKMI